MQCQCLVSKTGKRCKNNAKPDSPYCGVHINCSRPCPATPIPVPVPVLTPKVPQPTESMMWKIIAPGVVPFLPEGGLPKFKKALTTLGEINHLALDEDEGTLLMDVRLSNIAGVFKFLDKFITLVTEQVEIYSIIGFDVAGQTVTLVNTNLEAIGWD